MVHYHSCQHNTTKREPCEAFVRSAYWSSYSGYFREPYWFSAGLQEISRVIWQVWICCAWAKWICLKWRSLKRRAEIKMLSYWGQLWNFTQYYEATDSKMCILRTSIFVWFAISLNCDVKSFGETVPSQLIYSVSRIDCKLFFQLCFVVVVVICFCFCMINFTNILQCYFTGSTWSNLSPGRVK